MLAQKYAQALYELSKGKSEKEQDALFSNFLSIVKEKGHEAALPGVAEELTRLSETGETPDIVLITSKKGLNKEHKKEIEKFKGLLDPEGKTKALVDDSIIGGFVVKTKNIVIDGSYKKGLIDLYNKFTLKS